jgi:hypothetical protein
LFYVMDDGNSCKVTNLEGKDNTAKFWGASTLKDSFFWQFTNIMSNANAPNSNTKYLECNEK